MSNMHPEDIKAAIRKQYGSLRAFERTLNLPKASTVDVLRGRPVANTAAAIAKALGVTIAQVSPIKKSKKNKIISNDKSINMDCHRLNVGAK